MFSKLKAFSNSMKYEYDSSSLAGYGVERMALQLVVVITGEVNNRALNEEEGTRLADDLF